jgi:uncharacterized coiled-coil DUF342 family protein
MNAVRRKQIEAITVKLLDIRREIEQVMDDEQAYYDNMIESFQNGDKGIAATDAISQLEEALDYCDSIESNLSEASV